MQRSQGLILGDKKGEKRGGRKGSHRPFNLSDCHSQREGATGPQERNLEGEKVDLGTNNEIAHYKHRAKRRWKKGNREKKRGTDRTERAK